MALIGTYDNVLVTMSASGNGSANTIGQQLRALSMDGMKMEYQSFSGSGSASADSFGYIPAAMLPMIDPYRREFA